MLPESHANLAEREVWNQIPLVPLAEEQLKNPKQGVCYQTFISLLLISSIRGRYILLLKKKNIHQTSSIRALD